MNGRSYLLVATVMTTTMLGMGSAYAQINSACPHCDGDPSELAEEIILQSLPLSLWVDNSAYEAGDIITISGHVANLADEIPVTLMIQTPSGNVAWINQIIPDSNDFEIQVATANWSELGVYQVLAQYGTPARDNKVQFELTESSMMFAPAPDCGASAIDIEGHCVQYKIEGGMVTGISVNPEESSLVVHLTSDDGGKVYLSFPPEVLDDVLLVLVDGEESDDTMIDGNSVSVYIAPGTTSIELFAAHVIPEFGSLAAVVLGVALVSIVVVSARSRLGLVPKL